MASSGQGWAGVQEAQIAPPDTWTYGSQTGINLGWDGRDARLEGSRCLVSASREGNVHLLNPARPPPHLKLRALPSGSP